MVNEGTAWSANRLYRLALATQIVATSLFYAADAHRRGERASRAFAVGVIASTGAALIPSCFGVGGVPGRMIGAVTWLAVLRVAA